MLCGSHIGQSIRRFMFCGGHISQSIRRFMFCCDHIGQSIRIFMFCRGHIGHPFEVKVGINAFEENISITAIQSYSSNRNLVFQTCSNFQR